MSRDEILQALSEAREISDEIKQNSLLITSLLEEYSRRQGVSEKGRLIWLGMALTFLLSLAFLASFTCEAADWPKEMPEPKYDPQVWDAARVALEEGYAPTACFQRRDKGNASICITEGQWLHIQKLKESAQK